MKTDLDTTVGSNGATGVLGLDGIGARVSNLSAADHH